MVLLGLLVCAQAVMAVDYKEQLGGKQGAEGNAYVSMIGNRIYYSYYPVDNKTLCGFDSPKDDVISRQLIDTIHVT